MMTADDQSADLAYECMETIGVERLHALAPGGRGIGSSSEAASALVPTPLPGRLEVEGDTEPETGTNLILRVSEPSGGPRWCGQNPSAGPSAAASPEASARSRRQSLQETSSRRFCPAPAEQALALSQGRSLILPTPNLSWGLLGNFPGVVQVDVLRREFLYRSSKCGGPSFSTPGDDFARRHPRAGQRPDRRERSKPRPKPSLSSKVPEA